MAEEKAMDKLDSGAYDQTDQEPALSPETDPDPAQESESTPVEEKTAEETQQEKNTAEEAKPEEKEKPAEEKPPEKKPDPSDDLTRKLVEMDQRVSDIRAKIARKPEEKGAFDVIDDGAEAVRLLMEQNEILRDSLLSLQTEVQQQRTLTENERAWQSWSKTSGIAVEEGQKWYSEELSRAQKRGYAGEAAAAVARERWNDRVEAAKKPTDPPVPAAKSKPVTPVPKTATPAQKRESDEYKKLSAIERLDRGFYDEP